MYIYSWCLGVCNIREVGCVWRQFPSRCRCRRRCRRNGVGGKRLLKLRDRCVYAGVNKHTTYNTQTQDKNKDYVIRPSAFNKRLGATGVLPSTLRHFLLQLFLFSFSFLSFSFSFTCFF